MLPCDTLPNLSPQMVKNIQNRLREKRLIYFPLFTRQHWIAGILRYENSEFSLTIHDSAPSVYVHRDLEKIFQEAWPELVLVEGSCIQQHRGSEDCGIFMTAIFFATHTKTRILCGKDLPRRLRPFLAALTKEKLPRGRFMRKMVAILQNKVAIIPFTGGEGPSSPCNSDTRKVSINQVKSKKSTAEPIKSCTKRKATAVLMKNVKQKAADQTHHELPPKTPAALRSGKKEKMAHAPRKPVRKSVSPTIDTKPTEGKVPTRERTTPSFHVFDHIRQLTEKVKMVQQDAAKRQLCYFLVATVLMNAADGANRSLTVPSLAYHASRRGFKNGQQYDVGEALAAHKKELDFIIPSDSQGGFSVVHRDGFDPSSSTQVWFMQTHSGKGMPQKIFSHTFRIGAKYEGTMVSHGNGLKAGVSGHYEITASPGNACFGVYFPSGMASYDVSKRQKDRALGSKVDSLPSTAKDLPHRKGSDENSDLTQVLKNPVDARLNAIGLSREGTATSPEQWYIYPAMPSSLQPIAWKAKTPQTRRLHIRWLQEIRSMPRYLLGRDLPQAILEFVRMIAVKRQWKWSTYAKALVSIQGALENLPLYTNQKKGIRLTDCPEWREAVAGAQLQERQSIPEPPTPIAIAQMQKVYKDLKARHPPAALFLKMMWMFAARPGDILSLRARDLTFGTPDAQGNLPTTLTIREGKGAKFRGPYPVASILERSDASLVQKMVTQTRPSQKIFQECERLRGMVRTALKQACPTAALPSIRKGAVRHLARQGVPESQMMRMTGHTRTDTLKRYLGYGLQLTMEGAEAQANASQLLHEQNS